MFLLWFPTLRSLLYPENALYKNLNTGYALKTDLSQCFWHLVFFSDWYSIVTDGNVWKKNSDRSDRKVYRREELCANWIIY